MIKNRKTITKIKKKTYSTQYNLPNSKKKKTFKRYTSFKPFKKIYFPQFSPLLSYSIESIFPFLSTVFVPPTFFISELRTFFPKLELYLISHYFHIFSPLFSLLLFLSLSRTLKHIASPIPHACTNKYILAQAWTVTCFHIQTQYTQAQAPT